MYADLNLLDTWEEVWLSSFITVSSSAEINFARILVCLEGLGNACDSLSANVPSNDNTNQPRIGSGGPAGTDDQDETERSARQLLGMVLTVEESILMVVVERKMQ